MNRNVVIFAFLVIGMVLLMLALSVQETRAGCAAIYPNICTGPVATATHAPAPTSTPCFPSGMCRGKAPWKNQRRVLQ